MWLITTGIASAAATAAWLALGGRYRTGLLSLLLWGAWTMMLVDHVVVWVEEGAITLNTTGGDTTLGLLLPAFAFGAWGIVLLADHFKLVKSVKKEA